MGVVIRPWGAPVLPRACPAISRGVPGVTLLRPQRGSQSGEAEFRVRRSQATTWGRGHFGPPGRLSISPAPRAQNGHQKPRAPGGRQVAGDRRPGGGLASRCGESWPAGGAHSRGRRGRGGPEPRGPGDRGPGPGGRLPRTPPGAAIAPRSAPAPPGSSRAERGEDAPVPVPSRSPDTRARRRSREPDEPRRARP